jgi:hypothetical protein
MTIGKMYKAGMLAAPFKTGWASFSRSMAFMDFAEKEHKAAAPFDHIKTMFPFTKGLDLKLFLTKKSKTRGCIIGECCDRRDNHIGSHWADMHCRLCHGDDLSGGEFFNDPQLGYVDAPNLTPGGELVGWSEEDFLTALRTGVVPTGRILSDSMPWVGFSKMTDDEITAVWMYLQSLPALETNSP